jgi:predicted esterase
MGFSQGVSTVCRWLEQVSIRADRLILWAGTIPPELDLWKIKAHYPKLEVFLVVGTKDPFAKPGIIKEDEERLEKSEFHYQKIRFEGKHELHPPTLRKLSDF